MRTRNEFLDELKQSAQESIWKNELAIEYAKDNASDINIKATEEFIKRDKAYIEFLNTKYE